MKILRRITVGGINHVRGGFKDVKEKKRVATILGIARAYKEKVSETMGTSFGFAGEFKAINEDGEEFMGAVCYMPEPLQSLLANEIDAGDGSGIEFGASFFVVPNKDSILGYDVETESLMEYKPSNALADLGERLKIGKDVAKLEHEKSVPHEEPKHKAKKH